MGSPYSPKPCASTGATSFLFGAAPSSCWAGRFSSGGTRRRAHTGWDAIARQAGVGARGVGWGVGARRKPSLRRALAGRQAGVRPGVDDRHHTPPMRSVAGGCLDGDAVRGAGSRLAGGFIGATGGESHDGPAPLCRLGSLGSDRPSAGWSNGPNLPCQRPRNDQPFLICPGFADDYILGVDSA